MVRQLSRKRKIEESMKGRVPKRPAKKFKKQKNYDSGSDNDAESDFNGVNLLDSDEDEDKGELPIETITSGGYESEVEIAESDSEAQDNSDSDSDLADDSDTQSNPNFVQRHKRNDPAVFATSMSKILGSKLSTSKRNDPVLSRSITALQASKEITDQELEKKARHKLREERKAMLDKGRVKDVLGASTVLIATQVEGEIASSAAETMEIEKRLRKTAQRGVVKLFNAVRAAQIKGEEAAREARKKGLVGYGRREEKVNEMSKKGFLELIAGSGGLKSGTIQEA
jgi:Rrp15p